MSKAKRVSIKLTKSEMNSIYNLIERYCNDFGFRDSSILKRYEGISKKFKEKIKSF